jgi:hypothetical protein
MFLGIRENYFASDRSAEFGRTLRLLTEEIFGHWATKAESQKSIVLVLLIS